MNANVWEGGATSRDVVGDAPGGGPFSPLRAKWATSTGVAGGTPLVPAAAPGTAHLPGGGWARGSTGAPETGRGEVGSIDADLAECKRLELSYEAPGDAPGRLALRRAALRTVEF